MLFEIINNRKLDTYVPEYCSSACVFAFIGGNERQISPNALLGFHQPSPTFLKRKHTKKELSDRLYKAIKFYRQQGIDKKFVMRYFKTPPNDIWYPRVNELLLNNVITGVY